MKIQEALLDLIDEPIFEYPNQEPDFLTSPIFEKIENGETVIDFEAADMARKAEKRSKREYQKHLNQLYR